MSWSTTKQIESDAQQKTQISVGIHQMDKEGWSDWADI